MNKLACGALAATMTMGAAPALAQDVDWTGFYLGINAGYANGDMNIVTANPGGAFDGLLIKLDSNGAVAGVTAGANMQMDHIVFGIEGDFDWSAMTGDAPPINFGGQDSIVTGSIDRLGTIRARVGFAADRLLVFATAGLAGGAVKGVVTHFPTDPFTSTTGGTQYGYVVGGGVEAALTDNLSVKAEYLYVDLGSAPYDLPPIVANTAATASIVRVGLNYGF
jgi:outer membrane immunogenic protein